MNKESEVQAKAFLVELFWYLKKKQRNFEAEIVRLTIDIVFHGRHMEESSSDSI
jgi:hypothetical protein